MEVQVAVRAQFAPQGKLGVDGDDGVREPQREVVAPAPVLLFGDESAGEEPLQLVVDGGLAEAQCAAEGHAVRMEGRECRRDVQPLVARKLPGVHSHHLLEQVLVGGAQHPDQVVSGPPVFLGANDVAPVVGRDGRLDERPRRLPVDCHHGFSGCV